MRPVLPVGRVDVNEVTDNQGRAVGSVMREDTELVDHVIAPDDIRILWPGLERGGGVFGRAAFIDDDVLHKVFCLVFERAVISVGQTVNVETEQLATAAHDVEAISFDSRRGEQPESFPVINLARGQLWNSQLPQQIPCLFIQAHQNAAVTQVPWVTGMLIIGADEHFTASHGNVAIALRPELRDPFQGVHAAGLDFLSTWFEFDIA